MTSAGGWKRILLLRFVGYDWNTFLGNFHGTFRAKELLKEIWLRIVDTPFAFLVLMEDTHASSLFFSTAYPSFVVLFICKKHPSTLQLLYNILLLPGLRILGVLNRLKAFLHYIRTKKPWKLFCSKRWKLFLWFRMLFVMLDWTFASHWLCSLFFLFVFGYLGEGFEDFSVHYFKLFVRSFELKLIKRLIFLIKR